MPFIQKTIKFTAFAVATVVGILLLYMLLARVLSSITVNKNQVNTTDITIYLSTNGMHTDFVLPIQSEFIDWSKEIEFSATKGQATNYNYVAIGWGDKGFFLDVEDWSSVKPSIALNAAFGLGSTAMHTTFLRNAIEDNEFKKVLISKEQYQKLIRFIQQSFKRNEQGEIIQIVTDKVYGQNDAFYVANGSYSFIYTCNSWANEGLKKAGMKACLWTPFQEGIFRKY
ncbi:TIGR02117 family protein [Myroides phaeus]|uniref:TIGR02117 family protein n=1 Tax=Myroides phaeus TaxID=702745 RepID=A0A1G8DA37_9FLAO|nr:TIGR02117 family protein [Myroides phaeus]SDH54414.1 conserved hypothetical protein [Myroides phaeus]